jgi:tetratricopeptide (TPR) repeat protein
VKLKCASILFVAGVVCLILAGLGLAQNNSAIDAYNRGTEILNAGRYREAMPYFDEAIRLDPRYVEAFNNRGIAYGNLGQYQRAVQDFDEAIPYYDKAIQLNPRYGEVYFHRGTAYAKLRQYERAIQEYNEAVRLKPSDVLAYDSRGVAYAGRP